MRVLDTKFSTSAGRSGAATAVGAFVAVAVAVAVAAIAGPPAAHANPRAKKQIQRKIAQAMESFDSFGFEDARDQLGDALAIARKAGIESDPDVAQIYVRLGIVYLSGLKDADNARTAFRNAVEIDPAVELDPSYKTAEMEAILDEVRGEHAGATAAAGPRCGQIQGIEHTLIDTASAGTSRQVEAYVGPDLGAAQVLLHFRPEGVEDFIPVKMAKSGDCQYAGSIPGDQVRGSFMHYYIAAYNKGGKVIAARGSSGSPNIIEITVGSTNPSDVENPLAGSGARGQRPSGISATAPSTLADTEPPGLFVMLAAGTGGGYVTGATEASLTDVGCCFAPALFHLFPEIGYYLQPRLSVSMAFRLGLTVGANVDGHATAAPSGVVRVRYALSDGIGGLHVSGALGGGVIRNTVKLADGPPDMDTDTTATGPLLVGAGVGYVVRLGGPLSVAAELNTLAGLPVVGEIGDCDNDNVVGCLRTNFGVQFDLNVGLLLAF